MWTQSHRGERLRQHVENGFEGVMTPSQVTTLSRVKCWAPRGARASPLLMHLPCQGFQRETVDVEVDPAPTAAASSQQCCPPAGDFSHRLLLSVARRGAVGLGTVGCPAAPRAYLPGHTLQPYSAPRVPDRPGFTGKSTRLPSRTHPGGEASHTCILGTACVCGFYSHPLSICH